MNQSTYGAESILVLEGLEAVRKRPGMYIGSTSLRGLNHLIYEILDNSVDEHLAGYCDKIWVCLEADGSCTVKDNGRGIPVDMHEKAFQQKGLSFQPCMLEENLIIKPIKHLEVFTALDLLLLMPFLLI